MQENMTQKCCQKHATVLSHKKVFSCDYVQCKCVSKNKAWQPSFLFAAVRILDDFSQP